MIVYLRTSIFVSPAQTLVNTVNTVGVMGKGIAKEFRSRFPQMFSEYRHLCEGKELNTGDLHLWRGESNWVLNFPTKTTWRRPSKIEYIEKGLEKFVSSYRELGITSASFPPLGCGNGNLDWEQVNPIMHFHLSKCDIPIYIHNVQVKDDFVAEHVGHYAMGSYFDFLNDISVIVKNNNGSFETASGEVFSVQIKSSEILQVRREDGTFDIIEDEMLGKAYGRLRDSILSRKNFSGDNEQQMMHYLFPILHQLPYIIATKISEDDTFRHPTMGLFIERQTINSVSVDNRSSQGCLFQ